ncbi:MAG: hypothetical protein A2173_09260 [Planctomycetes bacterium RBG_13_44_8b]|nr:MAG: hypothetical protein A2173_09260 [Planctomycetes bacterium RBG_13_44_8b]
MGIASKIRINCLSLICFTCFLATASAKELTFYVTDFGIDQYKKDGVLKTGDDFANAKSSVFPELPKEGQVLIVMPPHQNLEKLTDDQIRQEILSQLKSRVESGIGKGVETYELQIIQHIGKETYFDDKHQKAVNRFGKCAYDAIAELRSYLASTDHKNLSFHGILGSNGTKVFSENIDAWKMYMNDATFFDGRAFKTPMIDTIRALGPENVRIFNTAGDLPAPNIFKHSIGNHDVAKSLKDMFPAITVGWVDPLDRIDIFGKGHLAAMKYNPEKKFLVKLWNSSGYSKPERLSSADLHSKWASTSVSTTQESGVSMKMKVEPDSVHKDSTGTLDKLKKDVLKSQQSDDMSWSVKGKNQAARIHPSSSEEKICLSLRVLSVEAEKKPLSDGVMTLAGIGWLEGFVIDPNNHDIILIGRFVPNWPTLYLDDLVVNMRNVWHRESYPYCSLDPRPQDVMNLNQLASRTGLVTSIEQMHEFFRQLGAAWGPQTVVVGGVPRTSRHAHIMIDADYHMKKLSQGLVEIPPIRSCLDIVIDDAKKRLNSTGQIPALGMSMSRFWFHIGRDEPTYQQSDEIICLEKCSVVVLTEKQRMAVDGTLSDDYSQDDSHAGIFAQQLSEHFQQAAVQVSEYADLENLFRLNAILQAMRLYNAADQANLNLRFYLKEYVCQADSPMPDSLPGLANFKQAEEQFMQGSSLYQYILFPMSCGGVSMEITVSDKQFSKIDAARLNQLRRMVLQTRPTPDTLSWRLQ